MANKLIYNVEDKPKFGKLIIFAFQQVLAVLAATIAVPTIIGIPVQIPAAILGAGLGTLTYLLFTKFKSPVIISSSFAFLGPLGAAISFGYCGIVLGGLMAGLVYVIIALVIKFVGTKWVNKLLPPVVIGPTVTLIGLSLASASMGDLTTATGSGMSYNLVAIFCGLVTFMTVLVCSVQNRKKGLRLIPFIVGIAAGYLVASIFTIIGNATDCDYLKIINWQAIKDNWSPVKFTSFFDYPRIGLFEGIKELKNGYLSRNLVDVFVGKMGEDHQVAVKALLQTASNDKQYYEIVVEYCKAQSIQGPSVINWTGVATCAFGFMPVAFVGFAEHIADHKNLSTIVDKDLLNDEPGLTRTLLGDGVGSMVGTVFGICPNTTYGESIGCVAITKNASITTTFAASILLVFLAFFSPLTSALRSIPNCVMGGVCLTLYGFIAVSGLKMFKEIDLGEKKNLLTVSAILIAGVGGLAINIPVGGGKTIAITSIAAALILGIICYNVCNAIEKHNLPEEE